MKKGDVLTFVVLGMASVLLFCLWFYLGLFRINGVLDPLLILVWWGIAAAGIIAIVKTERIRRRCIRTVYIGDYATFSSEKGLMRFESTKPMQEIVAAILGNLQYDFTCASIPEHDMFDARYFIRTREFSAGRTDDVSASAVSRVAGSIGAGAVSEPRRWKGEVVIMRTKEEKVFENPEELAGILSILEKSIAD